MDPDEPARIFYDTGIDHDERKRRLEAALTHAADPEVGINLRQYIADTQRMIDAGTERWDAGRSPVESRDEVMRRVAEHAARDVQRHPIRTSFLEVLLE